MARNWREVAAEYAQQTPSLESLFRVDLTQPEQESGLARFGKGALIGTRMAGRGLKGLFQDLTPEDEFELELMRRYLEKAGLPAQAGQIAAELPQYAGAAMPSSLLGRAALSGLTAAATSPHDRGERAAAGAVGSMAGDALLGGLAGLIRGPVATPEAKAAIEEGLRPTIGQALGNPYKTAEEIAESVPLFGSSVQKAHRRSMETFNTGLLKSVIKELNNGIDNIPGAIKDGRIGPDQLKVDMPDFTPGTEGYVQARKAVSDAYNRLTENTSGEMTPAFKEGIQKVKELAGTMRGEYRDQINRIIDRTVLSRFKPGQRVDGRTINEIDSELTLLRNQYRNSAIADERRISDAAKEIQNQMRDMMEEQNPDYGKLLKNARSAWFNIKQIEKAQNASVRNDLATPSELLRALKQKNPVDFAKGQMPMQPFARNAQAVTGDKYPDSGTPGRLKLLDLLTTGVAGLPTALGLYGSGKALYHPSVQDFLVNQAVRGPGPLRAGTAQGLEQLRRPASAIGAVFATD